MTSQARDIPVYIKLLCASIAGVSGTLVCYPLDLLRLNMQVAGEKGQTRTDRTTVQFIRTIIQRDGFLGLYHGLTASVARQALYTGTRLGLFQIFSDAMSVNGKSISFGQKCIAGMAAGSIGAIVGLPADVALTRMAVDNRLPPQQRRNYTNVLNAIRVIYQQEGFLTLYSGTIPTIVRAIVVNISQLASYFQTKEFLIQNNVTAGDNNICQIISSVVSSFVATTCTLPVDITKTRIQNQKRLQAGDAQGEYYKNMFDVWFKLVKNEGVFALWSGFTPLFIRNAPQFVVTFIAYERCIQLYNYLRKPDK